MLDRNESKYKKETSASIEWKDVRKERSAEGEQVNITKNHFLLVTWLLIMAGWISWSLSHNNYLLKEALPALIIVNLLFMIKAMGEK